MKTSSLLLGLLLPVIHLAAAAEPAAPLIAGGWTWKFTMPDGSIVRPELELSQTNGVWVGTVGLPSGGATAVTNLHIADNRIRFEVVRERDGALITTRYSGDIQDGRLTGKIESNWTGEFQTYDWLATHLSREIEGRWTWGARAVDLTRVGNDLKGKVTLEGNAEFPLRDGSFTNGEVRFRIERERDGQPYINIFQAKMQGSTLKGEITRIFGTETNRNDWEAKRGK